MSSTSLKIKGGRISHLTDARYFAAMGVHWLGIDLSAFKHPVQEYKEISEWVEVPHLVAEHPDFGPAEWQEFIGFTEAKWIQSPSCHELDGARCILEGRSDLPADYNLLTPTSQESLLQMSQHPYASKIIVNPAELDFNEENLALFERFGGVEIRGSEEEKIGYKSYEELDTFFDLIYP